MTDDPFTAHRSLLFTVAYEMLGSAADADDVVQETWLRWADVDRATVRDPRAYLVRIVTRQALNRLRTVSRRREDYVGEWLPEPLLTSPDVADDVELAESVSIAMLTVLETLRADRAGGPRAARGVRRAVRRDRRGGGQVRCGGAADRAPGARARGRAAAADDGEPRRAAAGRGPVPRPRSPRATCRACWTCSPRTSSSWPTAVGWPPRRCGRSRVEPGWPTRCPASPCSRPR